MDEKMLHLDLTVGLNDLCPSSADVPLAEAFQ